MNSKRHIKNLRRLGLAAMVLVVLGAGTVQAAPSEPYLVKDINTDTHSSNPNQLTNVDGMLFFVAYDDAHGENLYKSDGTEAGTVLVKELDICCAYSLTNVDGTLFFSVDDGVHGEELWKSDGTEAGTLLVKDIYPGDGYSFPHELTSVGGLLFFRADDGVHGEELWVSDGTEAGTLLVKDIYPGFSYSSPRELTSVGDLVFFSADDGVHGYELWMSDGTEAGTVLVKDIEPGFGGSSPYELTNANGTLFFRTYHMEWIYPPMYVECGEGKLWVSDGTEAGTVMLMELDFGNNYDPSGCYNCLLANVNDTLFFRADDGVHGYELYKSDGTEAGTVLVKDINPGSSNSDPFLLTNVDGVLFFSADDGVHGRELYKSDGTQAGTVLVKDVKPGHSSSFPGKPTSANDVLFFSAEDGIHGRELWMGDGAEASTVQVWDIYPGSDSSDPHELTEVNGILFFGANDGVHGTELWAQNSNVDLTLSKVTTSSAFLLPRDAISYTLTYRNVGGITASGVVISDLLPDGLTQLSVSSSGAAITPTPGVTYTWQVEDLEPGEGGVISITAVIDPAFAGGVLSSTATISSAAAEANSNNNSSSAAVTVQPPALRVFKSVQGPGGATTHLLHNDVVTYTITLHNSLNEVAAGVTLTDALPVSVRFGGWVQQGSAQLPPPAGTGTLAVEVIRWGPWDLPAGEAASIVFTATVAPGSAWLGNPVLNTAWFSSTNAGSGSASAVFSIKVMDVFLPLLLKQ